MQSKIEKRGATQLRLGTPNIRQHKATMNHDHATWSGQSTAV